MHMAYTSKTFNIFDRGNSLLPKALLRKLHPERWPFQLDDLPEGTSLVGGAVRDALIGRTYSMPDLDFVVPISAKETCKKLVKKYGGSLVILDSQRDIGRYVRDGWTFDFASQIGKSLHEDLLRRDFTINAVALQIFPQLELKDPLTESKI